MASLSAHLRRSGEHGGLPFHPDCAICRAERLTGTLPVEGIVPRRTQAAILASVLAASAAAPTVAAAQEPDQVTEGSVTPEQPAGDPALSPDFDPGGESDDLPFDAVDGPETETAPEPEVSDPGPLEHEPVTDTEVPVADPGDEVPQPTAAAPSPAATPTPTPTPTPAATPDEAPAQTPAPAAPSTDVAMPESESGDRPKPERERKPERRARGGSKADAERSQPTASSPAGSAPAVVVPNEPETTPAPQPASTPVVTTSEADSVKPGARSHIVQPGESLWSIARDLLGQNASPARVAREVNRLWELNRTRIATGDPDLLMVGTKLILR